MTTSRRARLGVHHFFCVVIVFDRVIFLRIVRITWKPKARIQLRNLHAIVVSGTTVLVVYLLVCVAIDDVAEGNKPLYQRVQCGDLILGEPNGFGC